MKNDSLPSGTTPSPNVLRTATNWQELRFYQKADTLSQLTFAFCERFLPRYGDRTVDQMVQAARSGKQNIVEGSEDGKTSTEMELKLLNVARSSIGELREDYSDYIKTRGLTLWTKGHPRFQPMQNFTRSHNHPDDYAPFFQTWSHEEMANIALTLCYQVDTMMNRYLHNLEQQFVTQGGIKERMHAARTGYRQAQDRHLADLEQTTARQQATITQLEATITRQQAAIARQQAALEQWQARYEDLRQRALKAYNDLKAQVEESRKQG